MPGGRPTELTPELIEKAKTYIASCWDDLGNEKVKTVKIPSVAGMARFLGHGRNTIYDWASQNEELSNILDDVLAEQEHRLLNNGLAGTYNSNIAKLMLGKHGYHDSSAVDHTTKGEKIGPMDEKTAKLIGEFEEELKKRTLS